MKTAQAKYITGSDVFDQWHEDVLSGRKPKLYPVGEGELGRIQVGPGLVNLIGGQPGVGKSALVMQWTIDALRLCPTLLALVCNVEMSPGVLLDRQLARLSGIDLTVIRHRQLKAEHADRLEIAMETLSELAERLCFVRAPFTLENVAGCCDEFFAGNDENLIVLDYIQRIAPPGTAGEHVDRRGAVDACMDALRLFADAGAALIVVSAVGRGKDQQGRSAYAGLNLASFRESSELEFGADSAFILAPAEEGGMLKLLHLKDRHGECSDIVLRFDRHRQHFESAEPVVRSGPLLANLRDLWKSTTSVDDEDSEL